MYYTIKYLHHRGNGEPQPVVKGMFKSGHYFIGKANTEEFNIIVEANSGADVKSIFVNFDYSSTITEEMYHNLVNLYQVTCTATPDYIGIAKELYFFVPGEDPRPLVVDSNTPSYRVLDSKYEYLSKVCVPYSQLDSVLTYWPDSFGHRAIIHNINS